MPDTAVLEAAPGTSTPSSSTGTDTTSSDTAPPDTSPPTDTTTPLSVCIPAETTGYRIPHARWALAALHGSRRLDDLEDSALRLTPSWFLASAWQLTGFGCADYGDPWVADERWVEGEGCLGLRSETVWAELCRLFPGWYDCAGYAGSFAADQIETSVMALTWYVYAGHALLQRHISDPDAWYQAAGDPRAVEKLSGLMHFSGAWTKDLGPVLTKCADQLEGCLSGDALRHVSGLADKLDALEAASCYDEPLSTADVDLYLDNLSQLWPSEDWDSARVAASAANSGSGFATDGPRVLDAIDSIIGARLICPEQELWDWYLLSCP